MRRPEIGARLDHLGLCSADPQAMAAFFEQAFAMAKTATAQGWRCAAPEREIVIVPGQANRAAFIAFVFATGDELDRYRAALSSRSVRLATSPSPHFDGAAFSVSDPDGNVAVFGVRDRNAASAPLPARLQHVAFRTPRLDKMSAFYEHALGFVVSDRVFDDQGGLRAAFVRSDAEHHTVALFGAPEARLDHHSYETPDWQHVRQWADRMGERRIPIFWGVGRHGPGNDVFFMVKDVEGNLVEISAELEVCAADRECRTWPHEEHTLNLWGSAIMRS